MIVIDEERCTACGVCASACPQEAISLSEYTAVVDHGRCTDCGACIELCGQNAIYQVLEKLPERTPAGPAYAQASIRYQPPATQALSRPSLVRPVLQSAWAWALPLATRAAAGLVGRWLDGPASGRRLAGSSRALMGGPRRRTPFVARQQGGRRRRRWRGGRRI